MNFSNLDLRGAPAADLMMRLASQTENKTIAREVQLHTSPRAKRSRVKAHQACPGCQKSQEQWVAVLTAPVLDFLQRCTSAHA